ncbi:L-histidine N(alpha)-methyltransferase [Robertkochia marina]|uniref:L-histidine N(Alpha)-methyltransferase n=1 Tax=Robertkochia marina TaxID=1227945 RepID=A0A4S3M1L7_9FLAO|nr:L-histidine N(alpha)-methyltransferase [Robertkochia marina]THD68936.1 L-histidine N(alpha)-methyltransferase [Robertkochia marina]TRZ44757.1 L-histidine N(alpha)-methyltransferase [Robertkochia marina]
MSTQESPIELVTAFEKDVYEGLTTFPKFLYSKYIYDKTGDELFQKIMELPEYYLTRAEFSILKNNTAEIADIFEHPLGFDLIELGAGDGKKTRIILRELLERSAAFSYIPIDISQNSLDELVKNLKNEFSDLKVLPQQGMYFEVLEKLSSYNRRKKVIMVLGSNIGNLLHPKAISFLKNIEQSMSASDMLFMGFDQKKDPQTILNAYNDSQGVTADFNKNLLYRINRELDGNFQPEKFTHWESYDPETGTAKSFLVATEAMKVVLKKIRLTVEFEQWETIHTEISQKYDDNTVAWLAEQAALRIEKIFALDNKGYKNYVFKKRA